MKCDELEELSGGYYIKEDVDEAIAELKDVIRKHEAKNKCIGEKHRRLADKNNKRWLELSKRYKDAKE